MILRSQYLEQLKHWRNEPLIKVVTGIRRCGKSTLLKQYQNWLRTECGIAEENIISVNLEDLDYEELLDYRKLNEYLTTRLAGSGVTYIFLDEIQRTASFEKVVDSLSLKENVDLYITGSNSCLLSGDLATLLTGRYVEITMLPFSFSEFLTATGADPDEGLREYMRIGGLPYAVTNAGDPERLETYLEGIYNTVLIRDIEDRQSRRERFPDRRRVNDPMLLKGIARYLASVVGSPVSVRSITNYLISGGRKVSLNTISDYLEALSEAFIFYPADRFDIAGKQILENNRKYYIVDLGLRNHILPRSRYDLGFSLENMVFFELIRRGYRVMIGKHGNTEVDFVAQREGIITYYQVTADLTAEETFEREMRPMRTIRDQYEKIILTADRLTEGNYNGIKVMDIRKWLK